MSLAALLVGASLAASPAARTEVAEQPPVPVTRAQLGSLQRAGAALHAAIDVYRLALIELGAAAGAIDAAAQSPGATVHTPVPGPAQEVFDRLHKSVGARVAVEALPAIARGYHVDVLDALERLSLAAELGEVLLPYQALARGMDGMLRSGQDVVDLFSRQRPVQVQIVDPETALDDINEALDEVAAAEQRIGELRLTGSSGGEQLQAFMRLEVALGRALDLIAAAEESGIRVGFEVQLSMTAVVPNLEQARRELEGLETTLRALARPPEGRVADLRVIMVTPGPQAKTQTNLSWRLVGEAAGVRLYRAPLLEDVRAELVDAAICEGATRQEAQQRAVADSQGGALRTHVGDYGREQTSLGEAFEEELQARAVYTVAPVSALGVEGTPVVATAAHAPQRLQPPRGITATYEQRDPREARFYRDADAVSIEWLPSPNDEAHEPAARRHARELQLPIVDHYRVARVAGGHAVVAGKVPAGSSRFVDRPSFAELEGGVQYAVTAVGSNGDEAVPRDACLLTSTLTVELDEPLRLARLGAASLGSPSRAELELQRRLEDDATALAAAREVLAGREADEARAWLAAWWTSLPRGERLGLLSRWPSLVAEDAREAWLAEAAAHLAARDREWVVPELWLADQSAALRAEVDRWWSLVEPRRRAAHLAAWDATLDAAHRVWVRAQQGRGEAALFEALRPARLLLWWRSRHPMERESVTRWWGGLDAAAKQLRLHTWLATQPSVVQTSVRWPEPATLAPAERERLLDEAWQQLPGGLWPRALAALRWRLLDDDGRAGTVASQVGLLGRTLSSLRWALRPLDRALDFRLPLALVSSAFAAAFAAALRRVIRRRGAVALRRPAALERVPELMAAAHDAQRPALFAPGRLIANDAQTLAGLALLDHTAAAAAVAHTTLLVGEREPFAQHGGAEEGISGGGFALDPARALVPDVHPFVASAAHLISNERPGAALFAGAMPEELPLVLEADGAEACAAPPLVATAEPVSMAYAAAATPHVLLADELVAAAADASHEPGMLASLTAADWLRLGLVAVLLIGALVASFGVTDVAAFWSLR